MPSLQREQGPEVDAESRSPLKQAICIVYGSTIGCGDRGTTMGGRDARHAVRGPPLNERRV